MKVNVFCLPFAGGSKYSYREFVTQSPLNLRMIPLELPGRGARMQESLLVTIDAMVEDLFTQVCSLLDQPYAIYGHSMGTLLGYLLTRRIIAAGLTQPLHLFFTGRQGPSISRKDGYYLLPDNEFIKKVAELGGIPEGVLANPALMEFFTPILKADFQAIEMYTYQPTTAFNIPMQIMIGTQEAIPYAEALSWQKETLNLVTVRQFTGKHFFIFEHTKQILQIISRSLLFSADYIPRFG